MRTPAQGLEHSFAPLARADATRLILGSMPGKASLTARQYYAHPRNAFWPLIEQILAIPATLPYAQRCEALLLHQVAVWDVLQSCMRSGSLDADIEPASVVPNDFVAFFAAHPRITTVYFNGAAAENLFRRHVWHRLPASMQAITRHRLPSTSPANAAVPRHFKSSQWQQIRATGSRQ